MNSIDSPSQSGLGKHAGSHEMADQRAPYVRPKVQRLGVGLATEGKSLFPTETVVDNTLGPS